MKPLSEVLESLAEMIDSAHGNDNDWWKGYVKGIKRSASIAQVHEAFEETSNEG